MQNIYTCAYQRYSNTTSNSHDYTAALHVNAMKVLIPKLNTGKSFILPTLSHKFGMYI